jgi:hypothetical protein
MLSKLLRLVVILVPTTALAAEIQPWTDYGASEEVWSVTTVRVKPNLDDDYLEGLIKTCFEARTSSIRRTWRTSR